jgi:hypothetical protein
MKSFHSSLLWGLLFILLQRGEGTAQPIQLIPHKVEEGEQVPLDVPLSLSQPLSAFWEGTPPSVIEIYFPKIPLALTSPVLRRLRAEMTQEKYTALQQNAVYEDRFLALLMAEGKWEKAKDFIMGANLGDQEVLLINIQWLMGESRKACEKITSLIRTNPNPEWKKQNVYCLYLNGEKERARVAIEVLSESSPNSAKLLNTLFEKSSLVPFDDTIARSPFLLTVWLESKQDISASFLKKIPSSSLFLIAHSENTPSGTRLLAGEKALQEGSLTPEGFLSLVKAAPESDFWGPFEQALHTPKPGVLLPFFENASQDHKLGLVAQVFAPYLETISPSIDWLPLAPFMVRAFLQSEKKELAKKWGMFFLREAPEDAIGVLPLLYLAVPEMKWGELQMQAWQAYQTRVHPEDAPEHSYALRRVFEALELPSGQGIEKEPLSPSWRQEQDLFDGKDLNLLKSAAESQRRGEVVLLVLAMISAKPLDQFSADQLALFLKALHKAGYTEEARFLGLEFLLGKDV